MSKITLKNKSEIQGAFSGILMREYFDDVYETGISNLDYAISLTKQEKAKWIYLTNLVNIIHNMEYYKEVYSIECDALDDEDHNIIFEKVLSLHEKIAVPFMLKVLSQPHNIEAYRKAIRQWVTE